MLTVGSLFSGIGGFDLGLERAGMRTVWFCEQDEFCQRVLARHWPGVPCHPDVRALVGEPEINGRGPRRAGRLDPADTGEQQPNGALRLPVPVSYVDVLCGGFPCQDLSVAGRGAGIDGERSGLWAEYARLIGELRPRYVIVENVAALLGRGLGRVLGDLAACGYDAEWDCIPASAVGAPHRRDRVWVVAYPNGGRTHRAGALHEGREESPNGHSGGDLADANGEPPERPSITWGQRGHWATEPDVGRVAHGIPARVDRLRSLGNALVPQIAQWIGERIVTYETVRRTEEEAKAGVTE